MIHSEGKTMKSLVWLLIAGTVKALTVQVLGSVVVHVLVALVIILFGPVLFPLASPGPADLLNEAEEAIHGCEIRMRTLYFGCCSSSSDVARVYVLHKELRRASPRETEKEVGSGERRRRGGGSF